MAGRNMISAAKEHVLLENTRWLFGLLEKQKKRGFMYAVVGGVALATWQGGNYQPIRKNGTERDIDILVMDDPEGILGLIQNQITSLQGGGNFFPPVEFNVVRSGDYHNRFQMLAHIRERNGGYEQVFRDVSVELPPETMSLYTRQLRTAHGPVTVTTLGVETVIHLYVHRAAGIKRKDRRKVRSFVREHKIDCLGTAHDPYRAFHTFCSEVKNTYPIYTWLLRVYNLVDYHCGSLISHWLILRSPLRKLVHL